MNGDLGRCGAGGISSWLCDGCVWGGAGFAFIYILLEPFCVSVRRQAKPTQLQRRDGGEIPRAKVLFVVRATVTAHANCWCWRRSLATNPAVVSANEWTHRPGPRSQDDVVDTNLNAQFSEHSS